jgi:excinuclease ABC subunit A
LLEILHTFVKLGNTVVVIEHNLDVIKTADYIVDMGPEGGVKGGTIISECKTEEICKIPGSYTGQFLKPLLG